jgi:hypothetical protein
MTPIMMPNTNETMESRNPFGFLLIRPIKAFNICTQMAVVMMTKRIYNQLYGAMTANFGPKFLAATATQVIPIPCH